MGSTRGNEVDTVFYRRHIDIWLMKLGNVEFDQGLINRFQTYLQCYVSDL